ncbi:uncharacterized protein IL334_002443 [Kwoniella shivajii]|uniref:ER membrane protein complex subunit 7 beta-sandwich domain-containing protein n=1 Tax=Kwoniella shivajii TaxID=564305 RepID=A0ABZ1CUR7_9TREE|nr:hypothetical protein IL334_002443 [Kwoniella shivajii]
MRYIFTLLASLTILPSILAVTISGQIQYTDILPGNALPLGSKVSLNYGERKIWIKNDGSFEVPHVDEGEYVLEPLIPGYIFQSYLITVSPSTPPVLDPISPSSEDAKTPSSPTEPTFSIHVQPYYPAKSSLPLSSTSLSHPLTLVPLAKEDYFVPSGGGGMMILGMLKSPMVLMMLFSAIMLFALPKLTASMADDPEMAKEMAETRKKMAGFQNMDISGSLSNMLAGTTEDTPVVAPAAPVSGTSTPSRGGNGAGGKKRRGR